MTDTLLVTIPPVTTIPGEVGGDPDAAGWLGDRAPSIDAVHIHGRRLAVGGVAFSLAEAENMALVLLHMVRTHPAGTGHLLSEVATPAALTVDLLAKVADERMRQVEKWGTQRHMDFDTTHARRLPIAEVCRRTVERKAEAGALTWFDILLEEVAESRDEIVPGKVLAELIQAAAVVIAWCEDVATRETGEA